MTTTHYVLGKIGWHRYMQSLVENGIVYMQRLSAFAAMESGVIGDPNEGLLARYSAENPSLRIVARIGGGELVLRGASVKVNSSARGHGVYCMHGILAPDDDVLPMEALRKIARDRRNLEFGDTFVIFRDTQEFIRRLERAARRQGCELEHRPVEYVPSSYCGEMGPFRKLDAYAYQSEWRFLTKEKIRESQLTINVGPLLDIAKWLDLNEAHRTVVSEATS